MAFSFVSSAQVIVLSGRFRAIRHWYVRVLITSRTMQREIHNDRGRNCCLLSREPAALRAQRCISRCISQSAELDHGDEHLVSVARHHKHRRRGLAIDLHSSSDCRIALDWRICVLRFRRTRALRRCADVCSYVGNERDDLAGVPDCRGLDLPRCIQCCVSPADSRSLISVQRRQRDGCVFTVFVAQHESQLRS
jgi:hypothetical protein